MTPNSQHGMNPEEFFKYDFQEVQISKRGRMNHEGIIGLGRKAQLLLDETKEVFDTIKQQLMQEIIDAPVRDLEGVHELKLMINLLLRVRSTIEGQVRAGKIADAQLASQPRIV